MATSRLPLLLAALCASSVHAVKITPEQAAAREKVLTEGHAAPVPEVLDWARYKQTFVKCVVPGCDSGYQPVLVGWS